VDIEDQGIGIREEDLPHIFSPFFTTKNNGTGLGLAVCYRIVKEHGGLIRVESIEGKGTTFRISLVVAN
jgi:signal transduction histidine kinase